MAGRQWTAATTLVMMSLLALTAVAADVPAEAATASTPDPTLGMAAALSQSLLAFLADPASGVNFTSSPVASVATTLQQYLADRPRLAKLLPTSFVQQRAAAAPAIPTPIDVLQQLISNTLPGLPALTLPPLGSSPQDIVQSFTSTGLPQLQAAAFKLQNDGSGVFQGMSSPQALLDVVSMITVPNVFQQAQLQVFADIYYLQHLPPLPPPIPVRPVVFAPQLLPVIAGLGAELGALLGVVVGPIVGVEAGPIQGTVQGRIQGPTQAVVQAPIQGVIQGAVQGVVQGLVQGLVQGVVMDYYDTFRATPIAQAAFNPTGVAENLLVSSLNTIVSALTDGVLADASLSGGVIGAPAAFVDNLLGVVNLAASNWYA